MSETRFDPIIHAPIRLQICALLNPLEEAEFQIMRDELGISDSVLSKHLKRLEEADYVKYRKSAVDGRQRMWAALSNSGRKAFAGHVKALQRLAGLAE